MSKNEPKRKFTFNVTITDDLAARLRIYADGNFTRNVGALFEMLDELGFFEEAAQIQARAHAAETAVRVARFEALRQRVQK